MCFIFFFFSCFLFLFFFFFSSRRRHTRCGRDWSSDVCSSDLALPRHRPPIVVHDWRSFHTVPLAARRAFVKRRKEIATAPERIVVALEIGRASCRERV